MIVCAVALLSCVKAVERVVVCRCAKGWLAASRALAVVVVARPRVTTERNAVANATGDTMVEANSDAGCVVFSNS